ncbi:MAG TPA: archease [Methanobacterium subterraneum]|uniref:Protein archease n=1 Tax=Methanobacterium subterraneum TaxID=59277 RepID=A0A2H4VCK1_9EURY|nr:archease [Methanobacterium subterraneum]MBW4258049.1 archease [Methanobacterium sp. YSL]PKL73729.1 MAG: archease [Methanobacteriales archaeon HGW-Methanobacteriales-2]AUB55828.1 archease [Methanobacterium subterraneum]AUB60307.1 archease [Methanobacterium subterraneum]HII83453.1 archease [Methanobacterium subterraneum]
MDNKNTLKQFEFFDVTADVGFRAYGQDLNDAFGNAALAMFEVMTDTSQVKPKVIREILVESEDEKALLYDWLSELLFIHDYEGLVFSQFTVTIQQKDPETFNLSAVVWGEEFNQATHEVRDEVKAVTFHLMEIVKEENRCTLQVIVDT